MCARDSMPGGWELESNHRTFMVKPRRTLGKQSQNTRIECMWRGWEVAHIVSQSISGKQLGASNLLLLRAKLVRTVRLRKFHILSIRERSAIKVRLRQYGMTDIYILYIYMWVKGVVKFWPHFPQSSVRFVVISIRNEMCLRFR